MKYIGFSKKTVIFFLKNSNFSRNAVECDWNIKSSQNVLNLGSLMEKCGWFFEKNIAFFRKIAECSNLAVKCDWKIKTSQNVQKNWFCQIKYMVFRKKMALLKSAKNEKFVEWCNWIRKISKNDEKVASSWEKKLVSRKKLLGILKIANGSNIAVECNWINKNSQNVEI